MPLSTTQKKLLGAAALIAALAALIFIYGRWVRGDMTDFGVCYKAGGRMIAGEQLYTALDGHLQFKYSPPAALFFAPLSLLPKMTAQAVWFALSLIFLFFIFKLSTGFLPDTRPARALVVLAAVLVLAKYIGREIELGQVNFLILLALTLTLQLMLKGRYVPAGLLWAFSLFFKPYALVLLPYFLLKRRFKVLATGLAAFAAGLLLPLPFYGSQGCLALLQEWVRTLSQSTPVLFTVQANASLYAFFLKILPSRSAGTAKTLLIVSCFLLAAVILWLMRAGRRSKPPWPEVLEASFLFILIPMLSPLGWYYNYLYALLAVVILIHHFRRLPAGMRWALAVNFFIICAAPMAALGKTVYGIYMNNALAVVSYLFVLACLCVLRAKKIA